MFGFDGEPGIAGDEGPELLRFPRDFLDEAAIKEEGFQAGRNSPLVQPLAEHHGGPRLSG